MFYANKCIFTKNNFFTSCVPLHTTCMYLYWSKKREMWFQIGIITLHAHGACVLPYLQGSWQWKSLSHSAPDFIHSSLQISFCYIMLIELNSPVSKTFSMSTDVKQSTALALWSKTYLKIKCLKDFSTFLVYFYHFYKLLNVTFHSVRHFNSKFSLTIKSSSSWTVPQKTDAAGEEQRTSLGITPSKASKALGWKSIYRSHCPKKLTGNLGKPIYSSYWFSSQSWRDMLQTLLRDRWLVLLSS